MNRQQAKYHGRGCETRVIHMNSHSFRGIWRHSMIRGPLPSCAGETQPPQNPSARVGTAGERGRGQRKRKEEQEKKKEGREGGLPGSDPQKKEGLESSRGGEKALPPSRSLLTHTHTHTGHWSGVAMWRACRACWRVCLRSLLPAHLCFYWEVPPPWAPSLQHHATMALCTWRLKKGSRGTREKMLAGASFLHCWVHLCKTFKWAYMPSKYMLVLPFRKDLNIQRKKN